MRTQEFYERTGFNPSAEEYKYIEQAYMDSNLDKDDFCSLWKRLNAGRLSRIKREEKAHKEFEKKLRDNHVFGTLSVRRGYGRNAEEMEIQSRDDYEAMKWRFNLDPTRETAKDILRIAAEMKVGEERSFLPVDTTNTDNYFILRWRENSPEEIRRQKASRYLFA